MAVRIIVRMQSEESAYFKMTEKNPRNTTEKLERTMYDPILKRRAKFKEKKAKG